MYCKCGIEIQNDLDDECLECQKALEDYLNELEKEQEHHET